MSDERLERLTSRTAAIIRAERRSEIASLPHTKDSLDRDVRTLLAALDAANERNAITHACWVADRNRANAAEGRLQAAKAKGSPFASEADEPEPSARLPQPAPCSWCGGLGAWCSHCAPTEDDEKRAEAELRKIAKGVQRHGDSCIALDQSDAVWRRNTMTELLDALKGRP